MGRKLRIGSVWLLSIVGFADSCNALPVNIVCVLVQPTQYVHSTCLTAQQMDRVLSQQTGSDRNAVWIYCMLTQTCSGTETSTCSTCTVRGSPSLVQIFVEVQKAMGSLSTEGGEKPRSSDYVVARAQGAGLMAA